MVGAEHAPARHGLVLLLELAPLAEFVLLGLRDEVLHAFQLLVPVLRAGEGRDRRQYLVFWHAQPRTERGALPLRILRGGAAWALRLACRRLLREPLVILTREAHLRGDRRKAALVALRATHLVEL